MVGEYDSNNLKNQFTFKVTFNNMLDPASNKGFVKLGYISSLASYEILDFLDSLYLVIENRSVHCQLLAFFAEL